MSAKSGPGAFLPVPPTRGAAGRLPEAGCACAQTVGRAVTPGRAPPAPAVLCKCSEWTGSGHPAGRDGEGTALFAALSPRFAVCPGDEGGTWYIDLKTKGGSAGSGKPPVAADVVMSMSSADFVKMFTGE